MDKAGKISLPVPDAPLTEYWLPTGQPVWPTSIRLRFFIAVNQRMVFTGGCGQHRANHFRSGGSGIYSLAPALIAFTAREGSLATPPGNDQHINTLLLKRRNKLIDIQLDIYHHQFNGFSRTQNIQPGIFIIGNRNVTALLDCDFARGSIWPSNVPTISSSISTPYLTGDLTISVMVMPNLSSTTTTSPRATRLLLT